MRRKVGFYLFGCLVIIALSAVILSATQTDPVTAFVNVNLVPMTAEEVLPGQTVLVRGAEIVKIGPAEEVKVPQRAQVIDGRDVYLLPGLADMHMHTRQDWDDPELWPVHPLQLYLANGVTTIRDLGPSGDVISYPLVWKEEIAAGSRLGPMLFTSGKIFFKSPIDDPASLIQQNHAQGFDLQKIYSYVSGPDYYRAIWRANELGLYAVGHIPYAVGLESSLAGGLEEIAHVEELIYEFFKFERAQTLSPEEWMGVIVQSVLEEYDFSGADMLDRFIETNFETMEEITEILLAYDAPVSTTMVVDEIVVMKNLLTEEFLSRPENRYFKDGYLEDYLEGNEKHLNQCRGVVEVCAAKAAIDLWILGELHAAGVTLVLGTDAGTGGMGIVPGFSVHDELDIFLENGFTPFQALKTATVNAAEVAERMTGEGDFGTIVEGNRADLLLVEGNPLQDISTLRDPLGVMVGGEWLSRIALDEMLSMEQ